MNEHGYRIRLGIFLATIIVVVLAIEGGFRLGCQVRQKSAEDEKESPVAAIAAAILTLAGFMLAFTFGIASDRFQDRKTLVREEANAIGTAWLRSDFLPEPDRAETKELLRKYVDLRLDAVQAKDLGQIQEGLVESDRIQRQIWDTAVKNARKDMNSDVAALYIESINEFINIQALRVAVALHPQIPEVIWVVLYAPGHSWHDVHRIPDRHHGFGQEISLSMASGRLILCGDYTDSCA